MVIILIFYRAYKISSYSDTIIIYKYISVFVFNKSTMKGAIIIEDKSKVDFHSTQLYINKKEDVDALNEDFESLGLTNKSDYLRGLIMLGLEAKKNQERNVSIKEKETLIKLDEVFNKLNEIKELLNDVDLDDSIYEMFKDLKQLIKDESMTTRGTIARVNKKIDSTIEHYDKVLGGIYKMLYAICLKERLSKKDLDNGLFDELPNRLKGGDLNK